MIQKIRLVVSIPQAVMKWSKRPGEVDGERKVWSTASPISGRSPHGDIGSLLALVGRCKPTTASPFGHAFSCYEASRNRKAKINSSFALVLCISGFQSLTHAGTPES